TGSRAPASGRRSPRAFQSRGGYALSNLLVGSARGYRERVRLGPDGARVTARRGQAGFCRAASYGKRPDQRVDAPAANRRSTSPPITNTTVTSRWRVDDPSFVPSVL